MYIRGCIPSMHSTRKTHIYYNWSSIPQSPQKYFWCPNVNSPQTILFPKPMFRFWTLPSHSNDSSRHRKYQEHQYSFSFCKSLCWAFGYWMGEIGWSSNWSEMSDYNLGLCLLITPCCDFTSRHKQRTVSWFWASREETCHRVISWCWCWCWSSPCQSSFSSEHRIWRHSFWGCQKVWHPSYCSCWFGCCSGLRSSDRAELRKVCWWVHKNDHSITRIPRRI